MKKNIKFNIGIDQICLARIGLCKVIKKKIDSIKNDPAIISWKNTFIQYRSRFEKRKCWKEKQKSILSIEKSLIIESEEAEMETEKIQEKTASERATTPNETLEDNMESLEKPLILSEIEMIPEKIKPKKIKVTTKKEANSFLRPSENLKSISPVKEPVFVPEKKISEPITAKKKQLDDIFVEKRPSYMVIQQFNLEESKNSEEIILEPFSDNSTRDEMIIKEKSENQIVNDPFFLDKDGNEIINHNEDHYRDSYSRDYINNRYDDSRNFNSSNRYDSSRKFSRNSENIDKRFGNNRSQGSDYSLNKSSERTSFSSTRSSYNNHYEEQSKFNRPKTRTQYDFNPKQQANKMDVSKLHPSWQAKKEMEEKGKVKFEGKKKTFSDD